MRCCARFDVKAESSRAAAVDYRVLATRLEARMRDHRARLRDCAASRPRPAVPPPGSPSSSSLVLSSLSALPPAASSPASAARAASAAAALANEKEAFLWYFWVEVDRVQAVAKAREERCGLFHDPKDRATERWLQVGGNDRSHEQNKIK